MIALWYVSVLYWIAILVLFLWLNRGLARVAAKSAELERREKGEGPGP